MKKNELKSLEKELRIKIFRPTFPETPSFRIFSIFIIAPLIGCFAFILESHFVNLSRDFAVLLIAIPALLALLIWNLYLGKKRELDGDRKNTGFITVSNGMLVIPEFLCLNKGNDKDKIKKKGDELVINISEILNFEDIRIMGMRSLSFEFRKDRKSLESFNYQSQFTFQNVLTNKEFELFLSAMDKNFDTVDSPFRSKRIRKQKDRMRIYYMLSFIPPLAYLLYLIII